MPSHMPTSRAPDYPRKHLRSRKHTTSLSDPRSCLLTATKVALSYGCLCGNNLQPNVSEYSLTLPYFVCTEWGTQCVAACGNDNTCASACRQDHPCGAQDPQRNYTTTTSSSAPTGTAAATTTSNQVFTGISGATSTSSSTSGQTNKNAAAALEFGRGYGLVVVAGSLFAGFAMML
jgi:hypothetical protein